MSRYSDYIVFVDESGDHGLDRVDPGYPVFVLALCIFRKADYIERVAPALQQFKMAHFGHDQVILHERDIRKELGPFGFLKSRDAKTDFVDSLTSIVRDADFALVCSVIDKRRLKDKYAQPRNPYHVALGFGLERVQSFLHGRRQAGLTHVVVECRGKREDAELAAEFTRVCAGANYRRQQLPLSLVFADKRANAAGLQFADLVARPVGLHVHRPDQGNRAFDAIERKFHSNERGAYRGWGLKVFPG